MRALLTSGIKAILAIAALSTAAHWALRIQREPGTSVRPVLAGIAEPETTGSVAPRRMEAAPALPVQQAAAMPSDPVRAAPGLDQSGLSALISGAAETPRPRSPVAAKVAPVAKVAASAKAAAPVKSAASTKTAAASKPVAAATASPKPTATKPMASKPASPNPASPNPASPKPVPTKVASLEKAETSAKAAKH